MLRLRAAAALTAAPNASRPCCRIARRATQRPNGHDANGANDANVANGACTAYAANVAYVP